MAKRFETQQEIERFLAEPRLAILIYRGSQPGPMGVPVWFDWNGQAVQMFAGRSSPKVTHLRNDPNVSVLVTNRVGEPEGWVAFDGNATLADFEPDEWSALLDRVAPRYWDLKVPAYAEQIEGWRSAPEAFVSLKIVPEKIRSGA